MAEAEKQVSSDVMGLPVKGIKEDLYSNSPHLKPTF